MEHVDNTDWKALYSRLNEVDIKYYTFQLLKVIRYHHPRPSHYLTFQLGPGLCSLAWGHTPRCQARKCDDRPPKSKGTLFLLVLAPKLTGHPKTAATY